MPDNQLVGLRDEILGRWIDTIFDGYPEETAKFLRSKSDRFANPVGAGLREGLAELLDGLIEGVEPDELESAVDRVIRVRAVQGFSPSEAVGFVFDLKALLRETVGGTSGEAGGWLVTFDNRIERLGLFAFDVYMRCREQMWAIRAREIRNQSVGIMERVAGWRERREETSETGPHT
jgi:hypothetical protein